MPFVVLSTGDIIDPFLFVCSGLLLSNGGVLSDFCEFPMSTDCKAFLQEGMLNSVIERRV